jgi:O-acetyl-ADP-ribose deacetylase (regulator of RNase III)
MLKFTSGNILNSGCYALINTVNTVGVMGKGIALQFKKEFPHNYTVYLQACHDHSLKIGNLLIVKDASLVMGERLIINFPTKTHWRLPSDYNFIEQGLLALANLIITQQIKTIALPALGCGNGGLDWTIVSDMILKHLSHIEAEIEVYQPGF